MIVIWWSINAVRWQRPLESNSKSYAINLFISSYWGSVSMPSGEFCMLEIGALRIKDNQDRNHMLSLNSSTYIFWTKSVQPSMEFRQSPVVKISLQSFGSRHSICHWICFHRRKCMYAFPYIFIIEQNGKQVCSSTYCICILIWEILLSWKITFGKLFTVLGITYTLYVCSYSYRHCRQRIEAPSTHQASQQPIKLITIRPLRYCFMKN